MKKPLANLSIPSLQAEKTLDIRFSEVDSMNVVWHGSYPLYFEDAREAFGKKFGLDYLTIFSNGYFAPLVELSFNYKSPIVYGMHPSIRITYIPSAAAKIIFEYEIFNPADGKTIATGRSVQVFMNRDYTLVWDAPEFYRQWRCKNNVEI